MKDIFLPTLRSFANNNTFSGSCGPLRFMLTPMLDESVITAQIWHGLLCLEKSTVEETRDFPLTEEGREALLAWLTENIEPAK